MSARGNSVISPSIPEPPVALVNRSEAAGMVTVAEWVTDPAALVAVIV